MNNKMSSHCRSVSPAQDKMPSPLSFGGCLYFSPRQRYYSLGLQGPKSIEVGSVEHTVKFSIQSNSLDSYLRRTILLGEALPNKQIWNSLNYSFPISTVWHSCTQWSRAPLSSKHVTHVSGVSGDQRLSKVLINSFYCTSFILVLNDRFWAFKCANQCCVSCISHHACNVFIVESVMRQESSLKQINQFIYF